MAAKEEIKFLHGEKWKVLRDKNALGQHYAISNYGRLVCYTKFLNSGNVLRLSRQEGYPIWRARKDGQYFAILIHLLVAKHFLAKPTGKQKFVVHKDFDKENNRYSNLKWASQEELTKHNKKNPTVIAAKEKMRLVVRKGGYNTKLTEAKVRQIKVYLSKGRTLKELALKYKVSDMQIHRIKTGENWGHLQ